MISTGEYRHKTRRDRRAFVLGVALDCSTGGKGRKMVFFRGNHPTNIYAIKLEEFTEIFEFRDQEVLR